MNKTCRFLLTALLVPAAATVLAVQCATDRSKALPCDIYRQGGTPCVTAHSTTRLLNSGYHGPLYQVVRESDGKALDIRAGRDGYADAAAQDAFCEGTLCYISVIYDQSGLGNDLLPAPPGTFAGPDKGGFNTRAIADMAPVLIDGHKAYGVYIMPGMGYRCNDARGLAIDDEPEGIYYVIDGTHFDSGCCFDYGNSSTNGRAVGTGTMETTYYGTSTAWGRGNGEGPWIMADMEAGLFSGYGAKQNDVPAITDWRFVSVFVNGGGGNQWDLRGADASCDTLTTFYSGPRPHSKEGNDAYYPMHKKGGMLLGNGGDNGNGSAGTFFEGVMTAGYPTDDVLAAVQADIASRSYHAYPLALSRITGFTPGADATVSVFFENTTGKPVKGLSLQASLPKGWRLSGGDDIPATIAPDESVRISYTLTAPDTRSSGEVRFSAAWKGGKADIGSRIRCAEAVKINEVALAGEGVEPFVELYNAGAAEADLSGLELVLRRSGQAAVPALVLPQGTRLAAGGFLLLKQAPEAVPDPTTIFIPVSTGPILTFPAGTDVLPATAVDQITVGRKLGIGLGGRYEVVTVTEVGTPATQSNLTKAAKAGDDTLFIDTTADLVPGQELTVDTGDRKEVVVIKNVLVSARKRIRRFGEPMPPTPPEPGQVELTEPLKKAHAEGVDVSCPGTGIRFEPSTRFAHESGDALQPFIAEPHGLYATGKPEEGLVFQYGLSASAGSIALVDPATGTVLDAIVYGSQQSNSSANGTIASPELATLEGEQHGGGCIAVVPQPMPAWVRARMPDAPERTVCLVRSPDGADADRLCEDFRLSPLPTPGTANVVE